MTQPLLEVEDLNVWFDLPNGKTLHAVRGVSFAVGSGMRLGMVGESGCGKTTSILALMGLLPPTASVSGRILFDGVDVLEGGEETMAPHRWKDIAMVFQGAMNAFDPVKRIGEQIVEPMELHGHMSGSEAESRVRGLLETVGIAPERARSYPHELSGGMRQRAAIAMALACSPKVLLADEPTTALDVTTQAQILALLKRIQDDFGSAVIMITHDLGVVAETADDVIVMYAARIVERGPVRSIFNEPRHPYTWGLMGSLPRLDTNLERLYQIPGQPPSLLNPPSGCRFHPRCAFAMPICRQQDPQLMPAGSDTLHEQACHLDEATKAREAAKLVEMLTAGAPS